MRRARHGSRPDVALAFGAGTSVRIRVRTRTRGCGTAAISSKRRGADRSLLFPSPGAMARGTAPVSARNVPRELVRHRARLLTRNAAFPGRVEARAALACFPYGYLNESC
jgi:hypothetical protein